MNYKIVICLLSICLIIIYFFTFERYSEYSEYKYSYIKNFLSEEDFLKVKQECEKYNSTLNENGENNNLTKRKNLDLTNHRIREILNKKNYQQKLQEVTKNSNIYLAKNFPIEYRKYEKGSFMKRHSDTVLYRIPQYECVYTISNNSDTKTAFYDEKGNISDIIESIPNSLLILRSSGIEHEVLPVTKGERFFLKFIFTETDEFIL